MKVYITSEDTISNPLYKFIVKHLLTEYTFTDTKYERSMSDYILYIRKSDKDIPSELEQHNNLVVCNLVPYTTISPQNKSTKVFKTIASAVEYLNNC